METAEEKRIIFNFSRRLKLDFKLSKDGDKIQGEVKLLLDDKVISSADDSIIIEQNYYGRGDII